MDLEYRTRSLPLAAYILAKGAPIPEIRGERGRAEFVFLDEEGKLGWEAMEFDADAPIGCKTMCWALRELHAQMNRAFGDRGPTVTASNKRHR